MNTGNRLVAVLHTFCTENGGTMIVKIVVMPFIDTAFDCSCVAEIASTYNELFLASQPSPGSLSKLSILPQ